MPRHPQTPRQPSAHRPYRPPATRAPLRWSWTLAAALAAMVAQAQAQVTGGVAIHGTVQVSTTGPQTTITTTNGAGTQHSVVNWQGFSVPSDTSTYINQPSQSSTSVNRVLGGDPSGIYGTLSSNGQVMVINPAGITVGAGAVVDTAGFTASTLALGEAQAKAGQWLLGDGSSSYGSLQVDGQIIARSGNVTLIAPRMATGQNALIQAADGSVILAAGQQAEIISPDLSGVSLLLRAPTDEVLNLGQLSGDAVGLFASQLHHSGQIDVQAVSSASGVILKANRMALEGRISTHGASPVVLAALDGGQPIVLGGADDGSSLHLSQDALSRISASTLVIGGSDASGGLAVQGAITLDPFQTAALALVQSPTGRITQASDAPLQVSQLYAEAGSVTLEAANQVPLISGRAYLAPGFFLKSAASVTEIGTVYGHSGIISGQDGSQAPITLSTTTPDAQVTRASDIPVQGSPVTVIGVGNSGTGITITWGNVEAPGLDVVTTPAADTWMSGAMPPYTPAFPSTPFDPSARDEAAADAATPQARKPAIYIAEPTCLR